MAVSGFDAFPFTGLPVPPLTAVKSRAQEIGGAAAGAIIDRLENRRFSETDILLPLELVRGQSIRGA